jgi:hypothetical protein
MMPAKASNTAGGRPTGRAVFRGIFPGLFWSSFGDWIRRQLGGDKGE